MWCHNLEVVSLHNVVSELVSGFFTQCVITWKWFLYTMWCHNLEVVSLHNVV